MKQGKYQCQLSLNPLLGMLVLQMPFSYKWNIIRFF